MGLLSSEAFVFVYSKGRMGIKGPGQAGLTRHLPRLPWHGSPRTLSKLLLVSFAEWGSPCPIRFYPQPNSGTAIIYFHGVLATELTQGGGV